MSEDAENIMPTVRKKHGFLRKIPKALALTLMALILLPTGIVMGVYSPWLQDALAQHFVAKMNEGGETSVKLGSLRLKFPLELDINDLLIVSYGDTLVALGRGEARVEVLPLLTGKVKLENAKLQDAQYQMGAVDSASCLVLKGRDIRIDRSTVQLSPMDIHVSKVDLDQASVNLYINPADTFPETPQTENSPLKISVDEVNLRSFLFKMELFPTVYELTTYINGGNIGSVNVDVEKQTVNVGSFTGQEMNAEYLMPDSAQIAQTVVIVNENKTASAPWTVEVGKISMTDSKALYTTYGYEPLPGLDFNYIQVSDLDLNINNFYNQASTVRLPLEVEGRERCGLDLRASGTISIDSIGLGINDLSVVTTTGTELFGSGFMGTFAPLTDSLTPLRLRTYGKVGVFDLKTMFPAFIPYFSGLRPGAEIVNDIDVEGTAGELNIKKLDLKVDKHIKIAANGKVKNVFEERGMGGEVRFEGVVSDISHWTTDLLAGTGVILPSMVLKGKVKFDNDNYKADLTCRTHGGNLALRGAFYGKREKYNLDLKTADFPVNAFMPDLGVGKVSATVTANGQGFDFFKDSTTADVNVSIKSLEYLKTTYSNIDLAAKVGDDNANIKVDSYNSGLDFHLTAHGRIEDGHYLWDADFKSNYLDLADLGFSETPATVSADLELKADLTKSLKDIDATLLLNDLTYNTADESLAIDSSRLSLSTTDTLTNVFAQNRDMYLFYSSPLPLDSIMGRVNLVSSVVDEQFKQHIIDIPEIQKAVMPFTLNIDGGNNNALAQIFAESDMHFDRLSVLAGNDTCLYMQAQVTEFSTATMRLDEIDFDLRQIGAQLNYTAKVENRPGTFDQWAHVNVDGFFKPGQLGVNLRQKNIKNQTGFALGATLTLNEDTTMTLHLEPYTPIINYREWELNKDNFISYDFRHKHLDADLTMKSDVSRIALYTEHANDTVKALHGADEDLILQLFDIQIQDWIALDPFAPTMKGNLSAGVRLNWEDNALNGKGTVDLTDFVYGKEKVGDFNVDVGLFTDANGLIKTDLGLWVNGEKTIQLSGALNDSTAMSPFNMDFSMIHFPLSVANPFLPGIAKLGGTLNGRMDIRGNSEKPEMNGYLAFEDATVDVTMLGSTFTMTKDTIPVTENLVKFKDFKIRGVNENPLKINGDVDLTTLTSPNINLDMTADNMQIVNTNRARKGADVYGKAFIGLKSKVKGNLNVLNVNADLSVLPGTDVTYVLAGGASAIESQAAGDMVKFVNFADTAAVAAADSLKLEGTMLNLTANLNIQNGTIINVDLGTNAQDRVQIQGTGNLTYVSSPIGAGRLTGRYTFSGGFIKYAPPLISNLNFGFTEGSYVAFTGDLMNPQLNVKAIEKMRANVSQAGQNSRLIYFDIILSVTGTLNSMNVAFNLETDDDITVANELASMSPTQRESEAMNLLLYNTYTGGSTKATSNLNGNPLFSFLTNSVNSWLANNVRGVDLSIGVNQYDQTTNGSTSTTTSYSYQVSKTLFNNRFKIVVGGSYSDDPNDDANVAESLINDISFEYYLNNARTMYLRLFRHTGYESILEGEITQTGVGFVYKKRISRLSDMFLTKHYKHPGTETHLPPTTEPKNENAVDSIK